MSALTAFGLFAVTAMLVFYALEKRSSVVHLCFRFGLCAGFHLWFSARRMAVWRGGSRVVGGGATPLVAGAAQKVSKSNRRNLESQDSFVCSY